jgi:hypothetical protein
MADVVALSWAGSLFFSMLENYIPNTLSKLKSIITGVKFTTVLSIRWVESTFNQMFGFAEKLTYWP